MGEKGKNRAERMGQEGFLLVSIPPSSLGSLGGGGEDELLHWVGFMACAV